MPRRLILMRHGKSDRDSGVKTDFDRPLNPRGERDVPAMARWLAAQGHLPQLVISSPALRARQTALLAAAGMHYPEAAIEWQPAMYDAAHDRLLSVLAECAPGKTPVMLVGHNPGMEELALYLSGGAGLPDEDKGMPTAAVVILELPKSWAHLKRGSGKMIAHMRPRWLADLQEE